MPMPMPYLMVAFTCMQMCCRLVQTQRTSTPAQWISSRYGLCVLELATKQKLDSHNAAVWPELLDTVQDDETRNFIHRCRIY